MWWQALCPRNADYRSSTMQVSSPNIASSNLKISSKCCGTWRRRWTTSDWLLIEWRDADLVGPSLAPQAAAVLRADGFDVVHVSEIGMKKADDLLILDLARREGKHLAEAS